MMDDFAKLTEEIEKLTRHQIDDLDVAFITECLLEMSNDFKDTVISWTATNIHHRLKLLYCSAASPNNEWKQMVNKCARDTRMKLGHNPTLRLWLEDNINEAWENAVSEYRDAQYEWKDLPDVTFQECPWTLDELLLEI